MIVLSLPVAHFGPFLQLVEGFQHRPVESFKQSFISGDQCHDAETKPPNPITQDQTNYRKARAELKAIENDLAKLFERLKSGLPARGAELSKQWLSNLLNITVEAAHSEIETAVMQWAISE